MLNRRDFIIKSTLGSGLLLTGGFPFDSLAGEHIEKLTILHTNDVHSRLEAFPMNGGKYEGQGGIASRAAIINRIRAAEQHVLLLDAGDIFQGSPHFNKHMGEPEIKAMNIMGYDACTMGNHDFDAGVEGFARQLTLAGFPVLTANYDFTGTALEGKTQPYTIIKKAGIKIGIFGLGIALHGLVSPAAYGDTKYSYPLPVAKAISETLKKDKSCDMVICLSHLGYKYEGNKISDLDTAKETEHIDVIIGGHTHTFLDRPTIAINKAGRETIINQAGWAGVRLGRLDFVFASKKGANFISGQSVIIDKQTSSF